MEEFEQQEKNRILNRFTRKKHYPGFANKTVLADWFIQQMRAQKYQCFYCETPIKDIRRLIKTGKLLHRNVGRNGQGKRGPVLEIDKVRNTDGYQPNNCVLACYYCNNDKSYTLDGDVCKQYFGEARKKYFQYLTVQLSVTKAVAS